MFIPGALNKWKPAFFSSFFSAATRLAGERWEQFGPADRTPQRAFSKSQPNLKQSGLLGFPLVSPTFPCWF